jgi:Fe-S-cluster containining protein
MKNSLGDQSSENKPERSWTKSRGASQKPGQQGGQITVNREYLERIRVLSEENENENWNFRKWLKNCAPGSIDAVVKALSQKYFALIDCKECGNCCRSLELEFTEPELHTIAESMEQSIDEFKKRYVVEGTMRPCPALKGNLCSIYERRPDSCRTYPHFEKPYFVSRLFAVLDNIQVCPIAFNAFEELKTKVQWSESRARWSERMRKIEMEGNGA